MLEAHVYAKKSCARQKELMEAQGLTVSKGSENNITPEDQWISKHSNWEDDATSSFRAPPPHDDAWEDWVDDDDE